eukprot:Gregarina_sp_Poly_1__3871@NODE_2157_length_2583_cov_68_395469_g1390_i0_p1_GENE_NODE_2157_length_2583_cov_68_395469_g1390_i0NODE_2157_length_2583_cov_68_395469_g1390_i0_p1_ORF_typecomplete_len169_score26_12NOT2_3_5/PF04153_18/3e13DUF5526/PF17664_1/0_21_NODE_2157_length_2583_cov_68_395469_g1390_i05071013
MDPSNGINLINLHLDLGACELLFPRFASPWTGKECAAARDENNLEDNSSSADLMDSHPWFSDVPSCYITNKGAPRANNLGAFHIETIFFFFYFHPQTPLQLRAAVEATNRGWRLHKALSKWIQLEEQVYFCPHLWSTCSLRDPPMESTLVPRESILESIACLEACTKN